ncbi:MAG TPA: hypothetical protein VGH38_13590 [Bryobacteraceae bacterium]
MLSRIISNDKNATRRERRPAEPGAIQNTQAALPSAMTRLFLARADDHSLRVVAPIGADGAVVGAARQKGREERLDSTRELPVPGRDRPGGSGPGEGG